MGDSIFLRSGASAGKWLMYDNSLRVPLIIYDPRVNNHQDIDGLITDVPATILICRVQRPSTWQGKSLKTVDGKATLQ
jgi:arylsulfatase A-like enzyme